jgi:redox-sensing transcriptional repressor
MPRSRAAGGGSGRDRDVSEFTTERVSVYLRCLTILEAAGVKTISSIALAERFHLNSAQIRKDLACFGELGIRGVGYLVSDLRRHLTTTLGLDRQRGMVIFGAGNLGLALSDYSGFNSNGFVVTAVFDSNPAKQGRTTRGGLPILPNAELARVRASGNVEIGVIAVPTASAQSVYDLIADSGIRAVLNFAPVQLSQRADVRTRSVDLRINLESLSFALANSERA